MATKVVGLDLGTHTVKACELVTTFRNFELVGFGSEAVDSPPDVQAPFDEIAAAARRLLERRGIIAETIMCALPPDVVSSLTLDFPFNAKKKLEAVLPFQLEEHIPFDIEDVVYDYQFIQKREDNSCTVLVSYVKQVIFEQFLAALEAEGIDPKVINIGALSYFNLYDQVIGEDVETPVAVLEIGHSHSELVVFDQGQPWVVRDVRGGGLSITRALGELFNVEGEQAERGKIAEGHIELPSEDTLVQKDEAQSRQALISKACREGLRSVIREVRRTLVAHEVATGRPVEQLYLTGGTSQLRGLTTYLETMLGVHVIAFDPLSASYNRLVDSSDRLRPYIPKSLALSLAAFNREHRSQMNFRKGDYAYTGDFGFLRGRIISVAVLGLLIVITAAMAAVSRKRVLEAEHQTLLNQVVAMSEPIAGFETDDANTLLNTIRAGAESRKKGKSIPTTSAFEILKELSEKIDFDLKVDINKLEIDLKKLRLDGKTLSGSEVERLVDILKTTKCYKGKVKKDRVQKSTDDRTRFKLSAISNCT